MLQSLIDLCCLFQVEAFKEFFVTMEIPPRAMRYEQFEVKLIVFNYIENSASVQVI